MNITQRALLVASIQDAIINPVKDMPDPEELFAKILKEEINMELWGNKEGKIDFEMKFDFYAWQKAGRPASPYKGSDAYDRRLHWKFNEIEAYTAVLINNDWVILVRYGGYFKVANEFLVNK